MLDPYLGTLHPCIFFLQNHVQWKQGLRYEHGSVPSCPFRKFWQTDQPTHGPTTQPTNMRGHKEVALQKKNYCVIPQTLKLMTWLMIQKCWQITPRMTGVLSLLLSHSPFWSEWPREWGKRSVTEMLLKKENNCLQIGVVWWLQASGSCGNLGRG